VSTSGLTAQAINLSGTPIDSFELTWYDTSTKKSKIKNLIFLCSVSVTVTSLLSTSCNDPALFYPSLSLFYLLSFGL
jgi:hypothetical protein